MIVFAAVACWWCRKPLPSAGYTKSRSDADFPTSAGDVPAEEHDFDDERAPVIHSQWSPTHSNVNSKGARRAAPGGGVFGALGRAVGVFNADAARGDYVAMEPIGRDDDLEGGNSESKINNSTPSGRTGPMKLGAMRLGHSQNTGSHKSTDAGNGKAPTDPMLKSSVVPATIATTSAASTPAGKRATLPDADAKAANEVDEFEFDDEGDWGKW